MAYVGAAHPAAAGLQQGSAAFCRAHESGGWLPDSPAALPWAFLSGRSYMCFLHYVQRFHNIETPAPNRRTRAIAGQAQLPVVTALVETHARAKR